MSEEDQRSLCPSAPPSWPDAHVFGVVGGSVNDPRVAYLDRPVAASDAVVAKTSPAEPGEVLRIAAPCATSSCVHFGDGLCGLVSNVVELLPTVTTRLPKCSIRSNCLWFKQEGRAACQRCPQVVTSRQTAEPQLLEVVATRVRNGD